MSAKVLGIFSKGETIKYISHLDFSSAIHRFVRMSGLDIAFSQGYNPKAKISFLTAVSTGVAFDQDPVLLHLNTLVDPVDVFSRLNKVLPSDIVLKSVHTYCGSKLPRILKSTYVVKTRREIPSDRIREYNQMEKIVLQDRRQREIDLKQSVEKIISEGKTEITYTVQHGENCLLASPLDILSFLMNKRVLNSSGIRIVITRRELSGSIGY